jgi:predicted aspartyl protease
LVFVDPTRRQFLISGATSLAYASLLSKAHALSRDDTGERQRSDSPEPPSSSIISTSEAAYRLTVNVHINGCGPYRFLVDTGADRSVIATDVATAIGLRFGEPITLRGVVRAVAAETVLIEELSFGSVRCRNLFVPVLPTSLLGADGYLGLDALDRHRVIFDFKRQTLQVTEPHSRLSTFWMRSSEVRVRAAGTLGHLRSVNCSVDGVAAAAFIDTGAEVSAGNTALLTALVKSDPRHQPLESVSLTDVTGGAISGRATMIRNIQLNEVVFTDCPLVVADFEVFNIWGLRNHPAVFIGVNFLRQFSKVSIDYGLKELRFELADLGRAATLPIDMT